MEITKGYSRGHLDKLDTDQFMDLCDFVWSFGVFKGLNALTEEEIDNLITISEPDDHLDALLVYIKEGYPYAVYEVDIGFTIVESNC